VASAQCLLPSPLAGEGLGERGLLRGKDPLTPLPDPLPQGARGKNMVQCAALIAPYNVYYAV
jgi:hypothetical protein